jgi:hypothetical protein
MEALEIYFDVVNLMMALVIDRANNFITNHQVGLSNAHQIHKGFGLAIICNIGRLINHLAE